jgi:PHP family Zn ribbon phosphoesterase
MGFIADLHLHSRFAYACSKNLTLVNMAAWAKIKGIALLSSADFTHPAWLAELKKTWFRLKTAILNFKA